MTDSDVTQIAIQTMTLAAKVAAPILLTALLVGFLISLFQAATQIQEQTLSFVPKMIAVSTFRTSAAVIVTSAASCGSLQISIRECFLRTARYSGM